MFHSLRYKKGRRTKVLAGYRGYRAQTKESRYNRRAGRMLDGVGRMKDNVISWDVVDGKWVPVIKAPIGCMAVWDEIEKAEDERMNCPKCGKSPKPDSHQLVIKSWHICVSCDLCWHSEKQGMVEYQKSRWGDVIVVPKGTLPIFRERKCQ